jgi:hypothetical protein
MIQKVFSIYDKKSEVFLTPFYQITIGEGIRTFNDIANDDRTYVNKHPEDYSLYEIAEFENHTAETIPLVPIKLISANPEIKNVKIQQPELNLFSNGKEKIAEEVK